MVKKLHLLGLLIFLPFTRADDTEFSWADIASGFGLEIPQVDINAFWAKAEAALHSESLDGLLEYSPEARTTLSLLDQWPNMRPYADWLRQRLDYFEVAREAEVKVIGHVPKQGEARPSVEARRKVAQTARREDVWKQRMAARPPPAAAQSLLPKLKSIFASEGLPQELAWLAEVESSMNPNARSPVGAVGLFQMMPPTAERFGLKLRPVDERLNPDKNARAAARYLKLLHGRFKSWPLALAAYNAGEGRVGKIMAKTGGKTFEAIADALPSETQMYVPKMDALLQLREGKSLSSLAVPAI